MIRKVADQASRTEICPQDGQGTIEVKKLFTLAETEGCAPVCDVFTFAPGDAIGKHTHHGEGELYLILEGSACVEDDGCSYQLKKGDAHYCQDGHTHSICNCGQDPMKMLAVVFCKKTQSCGVLDNGLE